MVGMVQLDISAWSRDDYDSKESSIGSGGGCSWGGMTTCSIPVEFTVTDRRGSRFAACPDHLVLFVRDRVSKAARAADATTTTRGLLPGVGTLACPSGVPRLLWVERLAARQHLDHLGDLAGPALSALHALDAMDQREPVGAREHLEHRLRVRLRRYRRGQVVGRLAVRRTGVRRVPPPVGARGLD